MLADYFGDADFGRALVDSYVSDTFFVRKDVVKRELTTPALLLKMERPDLELLGNRAPLGTVAVMMPKNSLALTLAKAIASSYLAGNKTIVYFPAQLKNSAPVYAMAISRFLESVEVAGEGQSSALFLRSAMKNPEVKAVVIYGDDAWIDAYKELATETQTKVIFEGPGNDPMVVLENADVPLAVDGAIAGGLNNGGQSCSAFERFFVHDAVHDAFRDLLAQRLSSLQCGSPWLESTDIGPVSSKVIAARIRSQIDESIAMGARLFSGGEMVTDEDTGLPIFTPAVLDRCTTDMPVVKFETFGPVFPIIRFSETDELLSLLDQTRYGLNASMYGTPPKDVADYLDSTHRNLYLNSTCVCSVNAPSRLMDGGYRRSGFIWEPVGESMIERTGRRNLTIELSQL